MPRQFNITVNGVDYKVAVEEISAQAAVTSPPTKAPVLPVVSTPSPSAPVPTPVAAAVTAPSGTGTNVVAQMGGVIAKILVKQGQIVTQGEKILELEAMKMKIPVLANRSGAITNILVAEGDPVEIGQALISIG